MSECLNEPVEPEHEGDEEREEPAGKEGMEEEVLGTYFTITIVNHAVIRLLPHNLFYIE